MPSGKVEIVHSVYPDTKRPNKYSSCRIVSEPTTASIVYNAGHFNKKAIAIISVASTAAAKNNMGTRNRRPMANPIPPAARKIQSK